MEGAEREPDHQVVEAEHEPDHDQSTETDPGDGAGPGTARDLEEADHHEQRATQHVRGPAHQGRDMSPDHEAKEGHPSFEGTEHDGELRAGARVDAAEPDADRCRAVRRTERQRGGEEAEHPSTLGVWGSIGARSRGACIGGSPAPVARQVKVW